MIWAYLLHLSYNMWLDTPLPADGDPFVRDRRKLTRELPVDDALWAELTDNMAAAGLNMVVIDLGDGVSYQSHPEIALSDAWSTGRLRSELARLRELGLEPIPKLNFSTAHDAWLGPYSRQVSTEAYYRVAADLIAEVSELFGEPPFFHLGMDEETAHHQRNYLYAVIRQHDLWWHDLEYLLAETTKAGARPWVWSDYAWSHPEEFYARMPEDVLQSNWYYSAGFDGASEDGRPRALTGPNDYYLAYLDLDEHGYDQVPTAKASEAWLGGMRETVEFCHNRLAPERLHGFMQTSWEKTLPYFRDRHLDAIKAMKEAKELFERNAAG